METDGHAYLPVINVEISKSGLSSPFVLVTIGKGKLNAPEKLD